MRGCDYYLALLSRDQELIDKLRHGTPYPAFQERLNRDFGSAVERSCYLWDVPFVEKPHSKRVLVDPRNLKQGQVNQRMLLALASDFYRPFRLVELHERVFPGEFYNPLSSPLRIHQAIRRLRIWLEQENIPLVIRENRQTYFLEATSPCQFLVPLVKMDQCRRVVLEALQKIIDQGKSDYSIQEVVELLGLPKRTVTRYLSEACEHGYVRMNGKGKKTRYFLLK